MANININVTEKPFINFSPVSVSFVRDYIDTKNVDLNYSNGTGQTMTAGQVLYAEGNPNVDVYFIEIKVSTTTVLNGSGVVPIEVYSRASPTQQNQTKQAQFDQSTMAFNFTYNSLPETKNIGIIIDNRATRSFLATDFTDKFVGYDGNTLAQVIITSPVVGFQYDTTGSGNWQPYVSGTWIPIGAIQRLRWVAPNQDDYYYQHSSWGAKDNMGFVSAPPPYSQLTMVANAFVPSPVQYEGYGLGETAFCDNSTEEGISIAFGNNTNYEPFVVGKNYSNSQGYPAQTLRIEGYSDENFFKNNNTGEQIPTPGFTPKRLRNSTTGAIITSFPYNIPIANINQITSELGGVKLICAGNPNPSVYTPMRYRVLTFRILDSNGNIGPLKTSIHFLTPTIQ